MARYVRKSMSDLLGLADMLQYQAVGISRRCKLVI